MTILEIDELGGWIEETMELQVAGYSPYASLSCGILIVEPHAGLLAARAMPSDGLYFRSVS